MPSDKESLRALIGGRWAVSWQGYFLAWPWAVLFIFSATPSLWVSGTLGEGLIRGFVVGTITYAPVGAVMWLASVTVLRNRRTTPAPIAVVAVVGGVAWLMRGLAILAVLNLQGLVSDLPSSSRLLSGAVQGMLAAMLTSWVLATIDRFNSDRRLLLNELVRQEIQANDLSERLTEMRMEVLGEVQATVTLTAKMLDFRLSEDATTENDVEALATASQRIAKDLARSLWNDAARFARVSPQTVIRSAIRHRPFAYWVLIPGVILGTFVLQSFWSWIDATVAVMTLALFGWIISALSNAITPRLPPNQGMAVYLTTIVILLASPLILQMTMGLLSLTAPRGNAVLWAVAINLGVFYPLVGVAAHVGIARKDVLDKLHRSIGVAEVRRAALWSEEARLRRDLAVSLHGGLQAELTASSMRARQAIDGGDFGAARTSLVQARQLIDRTLTLPSPGQLTLLDSVRSVVLAWDGLIDLTSSVYVAREPDQMVISHVQDILIEGIGNAVRHGGARVIHVAIVDDCQGVLHVTVSDDGTGVTKVRPGLGSSILDSVAPSAWSRHPSSPSGSELRVRLDHRTR